MKNLVALIAAACFVLGSASLVSAEQPDTPGRKMQEKGSVKGSPGASGYTPGHKMQDKGSKRGEPGASGYAPGHNR